jgi:hypothetical protein
VSRADDPRAARDEMYSVCDRIITGLASRN